MTERSRSDSELAQLAAKAWDIVRYAPVAVVLDAPSLLPELAERGKVHVRNAEVLGRLAVQQIAAAAAPQVVDFLRMMGVLPDQPAAAPTPAPVTVETNGTAPRAAGSPDASTLAIPDYDSLSASQVVNRLPSLSAEELEAVRAYEAAHRGRKTILNKVAQLG